MSSLRYFVVDVFAEEKYAGNQLAVFVDSGDLPDATRQRIAKETNYSETTADIDLRFPIQQVSTGIPFVIVLMKTLAAVKRARPRWDQDVELTNGTFPRSILVFANETYSPENDLNVRVFVDEVGVPEDPATGSGNDCVAGYLVKHRYFGEPPRGGAVSRRWLGAVSRWSRKENSFRDFDSICQQQANRFD